MEWQISAHRKRKTKISFKSLIKHVCAQTNNTHTDKLTSHVYKFFCNHNNNNIIIIIPYYHHQERMRVSEKGRKSRLQSTVASKEFLCTKKNISFYCTWCVCVGGYEKCTCKNISKIWFNKQSTLHEIKYIHRKMKLFLSQQQQQQ
jgi:hypothetical protein